MTLHIYNSLTNKKEEFIPINEKDIRLYVCGPTLYQDIHIGNARPLVFFDLVYKLLSYMYPMVTYTRNVTDIDDKIINKAKELDISTGELLADTYKSFREDIEDLNVDLPTFEPWVTNHIVDIIELIQRLIDNGNAYIYDGSVYFDNATSKALMFLANKNAGSNVDHARIDINPDKKNNSDFVLWKRTDTEGFDSPWGYGRPGWHIECSAMSYKYLGKHFDIHGGGQDLIFPHHENEIKQTVHAFHTDRMANYWMHNGFVNLNNEKMSKSSNNFFTVKDILEVHKGETLRWLLLKTHYRKPINFSAELLDQAFIELNTFYKLMYDFKLESYYNVNHIDQEVISYLKDDFNISKAIARLHDIRNQVWRYMAIEHIQAVVSTLKFLGFLKQDYREDKSIEPELLNLIQHRNDLRSKHQFEESDQIRSDLRKKGIVLEDTKTETRWYRVR